MERDAKGCRISRLRRSCEAISRKKGRDRATLRRALARTPETHAPGPRQLLQHGLQEKVHGAQRQRTDAEEVLQTTEQASPPYERHHPKLLPVRLGAVQGSQASDRKDQEGGHRLEEAGAVIDDAGRGTAVKYIINTE